MPLTPEQERALPVLDWLFEPGVRRGGRTLVMAVSMIRTATRNPEMWVQVIDHAVHDQRGLRFVLNHICHLIERDPRLRDHLVIEQTGYPRFSLNLPEPIQDWLPDLPSDENFPGPEPDRSNESPAEPDGSNGLTWHERIMAED